jgi:hypothetical protein
MDEDYYWMRHPDGPFVTLIAVATTYLHPEADELELLQEHAKDDDSDPEMRVFKAELRQAITHPGQLPDDELYSHVQYDDGSDEKFLRRLWLATRHRAGQRQELKGHLHSLARRYLIPRVITYSVSRCL